MVLNSYQIHSALKIMIAYDNVNSQKTCLAHVHRVIRAVRVAFLLTGMLDSASAIAQINFSQSPPMSSGFPGVLPNIILSIDDSGSMSQANDVTEGGKKIYRIQALKNALTNIFQDDYFIGKFRLAYEAMWNNRGFGSNRLFQNGYDNSIRVFDSIYQADFLNWIQTLTGTGNLSNGLHSSPSHQMIIYAGEYLKGNIVSSSVNFANAVRLNFISIKGSAHDPWNQNPGVADAHPLSCRRAYFIFMTDGLWNVDERPASEYPGWSYIYMPYVSDISGGALETDANYDANPHTLGDAITRYDPSRYYGAIYSDRFPEPPFRRSPICENIAKIQDGGTGCSSTLSDFSLYYWATDLRPDISNNIDSSPTLRAGSQTFASGYHKLTYDAYWNPRNDPATWQHMQTYTIGFGTRQGTGTLQNPVNAGAGQIDGFDGYDAAGNVLDDETFFQSHASGAVSWPTNAPAGKDDNLNIAADNNNNVYDLVHAAYNGRGKYYPATTAEALTRAFHDILQTAITQSSHGGMASATSSGSYLIHDTVAYVAGYTYDESKAAFDANNHWWSTTVKNVITGSINGWSGQLTATSVTATIDEKGNAIANANGDPIWAASIPAPAMQRNIFTTNTATTGTDQFPAGSGIPFEWSEPGPGLSEDPSHITWSTINTVRNNPLGDIVNSQPIFVGKPSRLSLDPAYLAFAASINQQNGGSGRKSMVYVGANDGMLHGFDAGYGSAAYPGTGQELVAYVPRGLLSRLSGFSSDSYIHQYWVNGSPFSGDAQIHAPRSSSTANSGGWATVLVGVLGAGGRGYFVLDVTDPTRFSESPSAGFQSLVLVDATDPVNANASVAEQAGNVGYQLGQPVMDMALTDQSAQITPINTTDPNGEWAVIMGNGYNSPSGCPLLLLQSLSQAKGYPLYAVQPDLSSVCIVGSGRSNGLSAPRPIDVDGNGTADIVYAGDLLGNLWKFDIASKDHAQWSVTYNGQPMFQAVGPSGVPQPITSAPAVAPNSAGGGFIVAFGTGRNLADADMVDTRLNSVYALYDDQPMQWSLASPVTVVNAPTASPITLGVPRPFTACLAASGAARFKVESGGCLYAQGYGQSARNGGALGAADDDGIRVGMTGTLAHESIDGTAARGWYFDIPDIANGNAAKVLDNPVMMSDNTLMFYSQNVAGSQSATVGSAQPFTDDRTITYPVETCDPAARNGAQITVNYLNLFTGNAIDNTIDLNTGSATGSYAAGQGNRFQISGVTRYIPNGSDGISGVGKNVSLTQETSDPPGRRVGWHIGR